MEWNGIMEWNHGMESWNGMEWNGMESCKIGVLHEKMSKIRTSGIEPESHPWKGGVLPLYYMRVVLFFVLFCFVLFRVCMCMCVCVCIIGFKGFKP